MPSLRHQIAGRVEREILRAAGDALAEEVGAFGRDDVAL